MVCGPNKAPITKQNSKHTNLTTDHVDCDQVISLFKYYGSKQV